MISEGIIPIGTYSVLFKAEWNDKCMGKNSSNQMIIYVDNEGHDLIDIEVSIAEILNKKDSSVGCKCERIQILSISRLDN